MAFFYFLCRQTLLISFSVNFFPKLHNLNPYHLTLSILLIIFSLPHMNNPTLDDFEFMDIIKKQ